MKFSEFFKNSLEKIRNICFPSTCYVCGEYIDDQGLCGKCWSQIKWISAPTCPICGKPFEIDTGLLCAECNAKKPYFDKAISVFEYNDHSKNIILKFKHADSTYLGNQLAQWMYRAGEAALKNSDIIIPVPIHFLKRLKRKYNQTEILANHLSKLSNIEYEPQILKKSRRTKSQEGLSRKQREENIRNSFSIDEKFAYKLKNKKIALIDDVLTTGSTVNECARILKKAGAKSVTVLTVARVTR